MSIGESRISTRLKQTLLRKLKGAIGAFEAHMVSDLSVAGRAISGSL